MNESGLEYGGNYDSKQSSSPMSDDERLVLQCKSIQTSLNDALSGLVDLLPLGWHVVIEIEHNEATWYLANSEGRSVSENWDSELSSVYGFVTHAQQNSA